MHFIFGGGGLSIGRAETVKALWPEFAIGGANVTSKSIFQLINIQVMLRNKHIQVLHSVNCKGKGTHHVIRNPRFVSVNYNLQPNSNNLYIFSRQKQTGFKS